MGIIPNGEVRLLQLTSLTDYANEYMFVSKAEQEKFFNKFVYRVYNNYKYVRQNGAIRVDDNYDTVSGCDYVMFRNTDFSNKWFYGFVEQLEYVSDTCTHVYFHLDVVQTFLFDVDFTLKNFISRAHVRDYVGQYRAVESLYPEQLEFGRDYVTTHTEFYNFSELVYVIASTVDLSADYGSLDDPELSTSAGGVFDNVPSAVNYYYLRADAPNTLFEVLDALKAYPWITQNIQSITLVPREVLGVGAKSHSVDLPGGVRIMQLDSGYVSNNTLCFNIADITQHFPDYKTSKLYTFPYSFIELTCFNGQQMIIKPEGLQNWRLRIQLLNYFSSTPRLCIFVESYNSAGDSSQTAENSCGDFLNASISLGDFPQCPVLVDNYILYQANNANSFRLSNAINTYNKKEAVVMSTIEGGANVISNLASLNVGGALMSTYNAGKSAYLARKNAEINIRQQTAKIQDAEITPPSLAGQSGGDALAIANGFFGIFLKFKTIRPEFGERLDEYFVRYGCRVNKLDSILSYLRSRENFNYIQTVGCKLKGLVPGEYMSEFESAFDAGITFWHNGDIGRYIDNREVV